MSRQWLKQRLFVFALVLLMFAAMPALASARTLYSGGTQVPVGTALKATSYYSNFLSPAGNIGCGFTLEGTLKANGGNEVAIDIESGKFANGEKCRTLGVMLPSRVEFETPACLHSNLEVSTEWDLRGQACSAKQAALKILMPDDECVYQRGGQMKMKSNTNTSPFEITFTEQQFVLGSSGKFACYTDFNFSGAMTMTTSTGASLSYTP